MNPTPRTLLQARHDLAVRLGTVVNSLADRRDILLDMVWDDSPGAVIAQFDPGRAAVTVNGLRVLDQDTHPDHVDPATLTGRLRHPVLFGATCHEAGHARSSRWAPWPDSARPAEVQSAALLEEARIEHRHLQHRPDDRIYLRASATHVLLPKGGPTVRETRWQAATAVALILGRVDAHVLTEQETEPVRAQVVEILGEVDTQALRALVREALALADSDQEGLLAVARRWVEVVGVDPDAALPTTACTADGHDPADSASGEDLAGLVADLVREVSTDAQITTGALPDPAAVNQAALAAQATAAEQRAAQDAQQAAQQVFAPAPTGRPAAGDPRRGTRPPTAAETAAARRLGKVLQRAAFRGTTTTRLGSATPPGRLSGRDALLATAQRTMGMPQTAQPFRRIQRRPAPNPPIHVAVAVDVSNSMSPYAQVIASFAWTIAHAAHATGGRAATVAFGSAVTPIVDPHRPPTRVTQFAPNFACHRFTEAAQALDGALGLADGDGARVLVVVSDGQWESPERTGGTRAVQRLTRKGAHVLWVCLAEDTAPLPGTARVNAATLADIPQALAHTLTALLRTT
ncbi:VWA domain-containing protein [Kitasatospora sp. NPDC088783]|uniref:VWA domain-containing protein n=1 Tax=Kitasatospora sp. NPDC088783 TaxID=3364077 RepID=UPI003806B2D6